jgi:hypothetical protein
MRILASLSSVLLSAVLPTLSAASGFDCAHINADGFKYDLSPLGGVHSLYHVEETETHVVNTTYVLDICNILKGASIRGHLKCGTSKNSTLPTYLSLFSYLPSLQQCIDHAIPSWNI